MGLTGAIKGAVGVGVPAGSAPNAARLHAVEAAHPVPWAGVPPAHRAAARPPAVAPRARPVEAVPGRHGCDGGRPGGRGAAGGRGTGASAGRAAGRGAAGAGGRRTKDEETSAATTSTRSPRPATGSTTTEPRPGSSTDAGGRAAGRGAGR